MPTTLHQAAAAIALAAAACGSHAEILYALADNGSSLVRFDGATPGTVTSVGLSGATGSLSGMDFRPADGQLYGYSQATNGIYTVNRSTGVTSLVSNPGTASTAPVTGIDFNPVPDRLRVVNTAGQNLRINVATGATTVDGALAFAAGDVNAGKTPHVVDAAYTNSDTDAATGTRLYYIDSTLDALLSTGNPNGGVLDTIGLLGLDTSDATGFDIFTTPDGMNRAYATLNVGGIGGLYTLNLDTGAATYLGAVGASNLSGLAVAPVPEPASLALALAGLARLGRHVRRMRPPAAAQLAA